MNRYSTSSNNVVCRTIVDRDMYDANRMMPSTRRRRRVRALMNGDDDSLPLFIFVRHDEEKKDRCCYDQQCQKEEEERCNKQIEQDRRWHSDDDVKNEKNDRRPVMKRNTNSSSCPDIFLTKRKKDKIPTKPTRRGSLQCAAQPDYLGLQYPQRCRQQQRRSRQCNSSRPATTTNVAISTRSSDQGLITLRQKLCLTRNSKSEGEQHKAVGKVREENANARSRSLPTIPVTSRTTSRNHRFATCHGQRNGTTTTTTTSNTIASRKQ